MTDIRQQLAQILYGKEANEYVTALEISTLYPEFKQALALISQTVSSYIIGEDEELSSDDDGLYERIQNQLRAEQRRTSARLLGSDV